MNHRLSHANGAPVVDNLNIETAGPRGPALLQDIWLLEKLAHFDREVIPERRMHAKGSGAHGRFTVTGDIRAYTRAGLFQEMGRETPVFVRFSTVAGERGAADAERDIRGFAIKFYTDEGNWDLVGNNTPVFFLRDPLRFPDLNHAVKRDPQTHLRSAQNNWDFWTLMPEALHQVTIVMSDRGLPAGYRHMHGFGSHTFSFINAQGQRHWVKFTLKSQQGIRNLSDAEAAQLVAQDRESAQRDLFDAIQRQDFPRWTLFVQLLSDTAAQALPYNPFDLTKVWLHQDAPLVEVGVLELNRNPDNYFAEVEQAAFSPAHVVPGIAFSPDKMLQARLFSYGDAQRYRLGVNHHAIPVNAPRCPFHSYHRDGAMRVDGNAGALPGIVPNSSGHWADHPELRPPGLPLSGAADHWDHALDDDNFSQPGRLFRLMSPAQRQALFDNTARAIQGASDAVKQRHIANCRLADPAYGQGVADAIARQDEAPTGAASPHTTTRATTQATAHSATTAETRVLQLDGQSIAYRDLGPRGGMPLLLLNRFRGTMDHWDPRLLDRLATERRVLMFDPPGFARSTGTPPSSLPAFASTAVDVARALGVDQFDLLGFSMGGTVALQLLLDHPAAVRRAVIAGSTPGFVPGEVPANQMAGPEVWAVATKPENSDDDFLYLFFEPSPASQQAGRDYLARLRQRPDAFLQQVAAPAWQAQLASAGGVREAGTSLLGRLRHIPQPVLVANGHHDIMAPTYASFAMAQELPQGRLKIYPDAGHGFLFQYADEFGQDVLRFLR